jgi:hypothetical protein
VSPQLSVGQRAVLENDLFEVGSNADRQPDQTEEVQVYVDEVLEHEPAALHEKDKSAHVSNTDLDIRNPRVHGRSVHAEGHRRVMCT